MEKGSIGHVAVPGDLVKKSPSECAPSPLTSLVLVSLPSVWIYHSRLPLGQHMRTMTQEAELVTSWSLRGSDELGI